MTAADIHVEVVFALAEKQQLRAVSLPRGATVADAIAGSSICKDFPGENLDPRDARRQLALLGRTMADGKKN